MIISILSMDLPMNFLVGLLVIHLFCVVMALTVHEFAHGFMAGKMGDPTPGLQGRVTLNPVAHMDPVGFLMMLLVGYGWAKPVPINIRLMRNPKKGLAATAFAGPAVNLCLALVCGIAVGALNQVGDPIYGDWFSQLYLEILGGGITPLTVVAYALELFAYLNVGLALFNLIPIPPLDGSNVLVAFLPNNTAAKYLQIRYYTRYIFGGLMLLSVASRYSSAAGMLYDLIWLPFDLLREGLFSLFTNLGELIFSFI